MQIRIVTMSLGGQQGQFTGEDELNAALSQPGLSSVEKQFFMTDGVARYSFVLTYDSVATDSRLPSKWDAGRESRATSGKGRRPAFPTQDEVLKAVPVIRRKVFDEIRDCRNKTALRLGMKGYLLANNYQLAHIACRAPQRMEDLRGIHELGEKFCELCGERVLELVKGLEPMGLAAPVDAWWSLEKCYSGDGGAGDLSNRPYQGDGAENAHDDDAENGYGDGAENAHDDGAANGRAALTKRPEGTEEATV